MDRPLGPVHDFIRRVQDEIRHYSNYYGAIRAISMGLSQAKEKDSNSVTSQGLISRPSSFDQVSGATGNRNININSSNSNNDEMVTNNKSCGNFNDSAVTVQNAGQISQEGTQKGKVTQIQWVINRAQKYRLLLLRADAYSATKQHEKALEDAQAALQLTHGSSPEAYFIMGREFLRLFRVAESVSAFEKAESLLQLVLATGEELFCEEITDQNFWAKRGFRMTEAEQLKLDRRKVEQEEQAAYVALVEQCTNAEGAVVSPCTSLSAIQEEGISWNSFQLLTWRQLANEAKAFLTMRTSHILPINVLQTTLVLLDRRMSLVHSGVVACVENTTTQVFRLVGCASPDANYYANMHFPDTIPPGYCGLALLQPRGWGGFVCSVCYEVAENGVRCYFCFESSFMGSVKCGVRFASERRCLELSHFSTDLNSSMSGSSSSNMSSKEFVNFKIPNPSLWLSTHIAPLPTGCKLKVLGATRGSTRVAFFSVTEILSVRLRSVELLTALEFAGPTVLKKMSAVNRRCRELVNNFPPQMFHGAGRNSYPDYCLRSDRRSSPWIVYDKEPVRWNIVFDGHVMNRENYAVTDAENLRNDILLFSGEGGKSLEAIVYYCDRRSPIAHIKSSWVPFSNTLYFSTPSGRTFASCFVNRNSQLTLAWGSAGKKGKPEDVEYVMYRKEYTRHDRVFRRGSNTSKSFSMNGVNDTDTSEFMLMHSPVETMLPSASMSTSKGYRSSSMETYAILRSQRTSGGGIASSTTQQTNSGMELVAELAFYGAPTQKSVKGAKIGEILLHTGSDALLVTLMAYCQFQWEV